MASSIDPGNGLLPAGAAAGPSGRGLLAPGREVPG